MPKISVDEFKIILAKTFVDSYDIYKQMMVDVNNQISEKFSEDYMYDSYDDFCNELLNSACDNILQGKSYKSMDLFIQDSQNELLKKNFEKISKNQKLF